MFNMNSSQNIRLAHECVKRLSELLGYGTYTDNIGRYESNEDGRTSNIVIARDDRVNLPVRLNYPDTPLADIWQRDNEIKVFGLDDSNIGDNITDIVENLYAERRDDVETEVSSRCLIRKTIRVKINTFNSITAEFLYTDRLQTKLKFRDSDSLAEFIYKQLTEDGIKYLDVVSKVKKHMKICDIKHDAI